MEPETVRRGPGRPPKPRPESAEFVIKRPVPKIEEPSPAESSASDTVVVACKIPMGVILRCGNFVTTWEPVLSGGMKEVRVWQPDPEKTFTVKGPARAFGEDYSAPVYGGYALTPHVPHEIWDRWLADNKDSAMVKNNLIFALPKFDSARDKAIEMKHVRTGLEPLAQKNDPRAKGVEPRTKD
jgi:hypothetical protein